jgi:hypothetical protein
MTVSSNKPSVLEGFHTRSELAADLGVTERTIIRYEHQGLSVIRRGKLRLYEVERTRAWLRGEVKRNRGKAA